MAIEPIWSRKPKHKQVVVATSRGWEVEPTGELLVSVRNLDQRLKELHSAPTVTELQAKDETNDLVMPVVGPTIIEEQPEIPVVQGPTIVETPADEVTPIVGLEDTVLVKEDANNEKVIENVLDVAEDTSDETSLDEVTVMPEVIVVPPQAEFVNDEPVAAVKRKPGRPKKVVKE